MNTNTSKNTHTYTPDNNNGAIQVMRSKRCRLNTTLLQFLVLFEAKQSLVVSVTAYFILNQAQPLEEAKQTENKGKNINIKWNNKKLVVLR